MTKSQSVDTTFCRHITAQVQPTYSNTNTNVGFVTSVTADLLVFEIILRLRCLQILAGCAVPVGSKKMNAGVKLGRDVMVAIGKELRAKYADIVAEAVPEQLAEILHRLDESSGAAAKRDQPPAACS